MFAIQKVNAVKRTVAELTLIKMCDETLVASNENLLSRISKLEDAMVLGLPARSTLPETVTEASPEKENEPANPAEPARETVEPEKTAATERVLKYLSCWIEVIDRVAKTDGAGASYLKQTKAYTDVDGSIYVMVPDAFTMMMLDTRKMRDNVRAALSICLKKEVSESKLIFERTDSALPENEEDLMIDKIIQNAQ